MKKIYFLLLMVLGVSGVWGQQLIGTFPYMNGGFEGQTPGALGTTLSSTAWSRQSQSGASSSIVSNSALARSGNQYATVSAASTTSRGLQSPQDAIAANGPASSTSYVIQYYIRNSATVSAFQMGNVTVNGTTNPGTYPTAATLAVNSSWTKLSAVISTPSNAATTAGIGIAGRSTTGNFDVDDYVIYAGTAVDNTAPNSPGTLTISNPTNTTLDLSWVAASGGVDGGGYIVVRYTGTPGANDDPLVNGIYAVGNSVAGSLTGTIAYIGTGTSFTDNGLTAGATYYYKIYTTDKAFNYSVETTGSGTTTGAASTATQLVITSILPTTPTAGLAFSVTVQSQDALNVPTNVLVNTTVNLSLVTGTGTLGGTITGTITAGTNSVTITGVTYSVGENGVIIQAADASAALTAGTKTFNVLAAASQLAFVGVPASGGTNSPLTSFTVEARRPDNSLDNTYTGNITVSKATGSGTLSGTVTVAAVAGVATFSTLQFDQPDTYTLNANASGLTQATSGSIVITTASSATDYFRTNVINGNWTTPATWQSSPDNATWQTATLSPNENANSIYIQAGDTVVVNTAVSADQVIIQNGGVINNTAGVFTLQDGAGDDLIIENGGVFIAASSSTSPAFGATGVRINVNTGGLFRLAKSGYTAAGTGVNSVNFIFGNASILEYATTSGYSASGVTYFPNVDAVTVPIFRTTAVTSAGGGSNTVFNGLFEANANATFTGAGTKTFRNGIIGTANVTGSASGKFIISGATSTIGGTGSLTVPATDGMDIGNGTSAAVTVSSSKTITGNIALLTNSIVQLGNNNLTVTGNITGASATSYIATNGSGSLTLNNIGATPTVFPVGTGTDYTPATITNNGTADNFTVNVAAATPCNADPLQSVNRVWTISEATAGGSLADITMQWNSADENVAFVRAFCEAVHCAGGVVDMQSPKSTAGGSDPYTQTITGVSSFSPFGVTSALIALPISIEYLQGSKQGTNHNLAWKVNCTNAPSVAITLERSNNGHDFTPIYNITATALQCQQAFVYTDANPLAGVNYYRLKITDASGKYSYSSIVALMNAVKGLEIVNISPNPITGGQFKLNVTSAAQTKMDVVITDMQGRVVSREPVNVNSGFTAISMNIARLAPGIYQLQGNTTEGKTRTLNIVKQ